MNCIIINNSIEGRVLLLTDVSVILRAKVSVSKGFVYFHFKSSNDCQAFKFGLTQVDEGEIPTVKTVVELTFRAFSLSHSL